MAEAEKTAAATQELLRDAFTRLIEHVDELTDGLTDETSNYRPTRDANSIAWLIWHSARVQDIQLAQVAGVEEVWTRDGWVDRFGLELPRRDTGYGHSPDEVAKVRAPADLLSGYYHAVHQLTLEYVAGVTADELSRDRRHQLGSAGHRQRAVGEHHRRLRTAPWPGRLRAGDRTVDWPVDWASAIRGDVGAVAGRDRCAGGGSPGGMGAAEHRRRGRLRRVRPERPRATRPCSPPPRLNSPRGRWR